MLNELMTEALAGFIEELRKRPKVRFWVTVVSSIVGIASAVLWQTANILFVEGITKSVVEIAPGFLLVSGFVFILALASYSSIRFRNPGRLYSERIAEAESKIEDEPTQITPAWDLARITLEAYFNRNLGQITAIFWLSVTVMFIGFVIIVWGITQSIRSPELIAPAAIAAGAGVITEFIGATFLFIYRSAIEQAINYSKTLERINSVGMAMKILDTMPDETKDEDLKSKTKATLVELLIKQAQKESEAG